MLAKELIKQQLPYLLKGTDFKFLSGRYEGKVRDNYLQGDKRFLITSDRVSCFDVVVTTVPFKGQTLNQMAVHWFKLSSPIVANHIIDVPDPNVMVVSNCEMLPVEVVVRGYLTGSAWRDYQAGKAISGIKLPPGLKNSQKLPENLITPSTKAAKGDHDLPISEAEILSSGLVEKKRWHEVRESALNLFALGQKNAAEHGLILVDTKYEFGLLNGKLLLADEIHTMDSSRYWVAASYGERFKNDESPQMLDKEPTRQWLLAQGYQGTGPIPNFTDQHRVEIAERYIEAFEKITGCAFEAEVGPVAERVERNVRSYLLQPPRKS